MAWYWWYLVIAVVSLVPLSIISGVVDRRREIRGDSFDSVTSAAISIVMALLWPLSMLLMVSTGLVDLGRWFSK